MDIKFVLVVLVLNCLNAPDSVHEVLQSSQALAWGNRLHQTLGCFITLHLLDKNNWGETINTHIMFYKSFVKKIINNKNGTEFLITRVI